MATPNALILRAPGTNCDAETAFALERAGATTTRMHVNALRESPDRLKDFQILVVAGGFSYGDDVAAGKIYAVQLQQFLAEALRRFRDAEKLILGVCNGFQVLLKAGLIVPPDDDGPLATLGFNDTGRYEDRWVHLEVTPGHNCPFLKGVDRMFVPVAHGEGNFVCRKEYIVRGLAQAKQAVLRYVDEKGRRGGYPINPNGSQDDIAGVCDITGRVLGLMPHPERNVLPTHNPRWTRDGLKAEGDGMAVYRNAVEYFKEW